MDTEQRIRMLGEALRQVRAMMREMDECEVAEAMLALSMGGGHAGAALAEAEWIADTLGMVVEHAREVEAEMEVEDGSK